MLDWYEVYLGWIIGVKVKLKVYDETWVDTSAAKLSVNLSVASKKCSTKLFAKVLSKVNTFMHTNPAVDAWCPRCSRRSGPRWHSLWWSIWAASREPASSSALPASLWAPSTCDSQSRNTHTWELQHLLQVSTRWPWTAATCWTTCVKVSNLSISYCFLIPVKPVCTNGLSCAVEMLQGHLSFIQLIWTDTRKDSMICQRILFVRHLFLSSLLFFFTSGTLSRVHQGLV